MAVSDYNTFYILTVNEENRGFTISKKSHSTFYYYKEEEKKLKSVSGIAFGKNGNIFVADSGEGRIQIFDRECKFVDEFGKEGSPDSQLSRPLGLSVNSEGNVIVSDGGNKLVKIFSPDGQFLMQFGKQGCFSEPWHCIQYDQYLIVSDNLEGYVKVFDMNGNFLYNIGKPGSGTGELNHPKCLSVNKFGQLMVCDSGNHRIQLFDLNGNCVGKFGSYDRGRFCFPSSAAVLSNGKIAVSDVNRILIWD